MRPSFQNWIKPTVPACRFSFQTVVSLIFCLGLFSLAGSNSVAQQVNDLKNSAEANNVNWKMFESEEGRFEILFPGFPKASQETVDSPVWKFVVHKFELKTFAEYRVMYADYPEAVIKATPADLLLDEGAKAAVAEAHSELVSIGSINVSGYPGKVRKERLPGGNLVRAIMVLAGPRMYHITVTTPKEEGATPEAVGFYEVTAKKFLDSFVLVRSSVAVGEIQNLTACPPDASNCFSGEGLTARALIVTQPEYPEIARAAHAAGIVVITVLVDEAGNVISAHAVSGHPLLQAAAVAAARNAKFTPLIVNDKPVKFSGVLQYKFPPEQ
ncbi:MAG TPA: TonB family protein [Pyrinomonadaceae bacterium]